MVLEAVSGGQSQYPVSWLGARRCGDFVAEFRDAMRVAGLNTNADIVTDGRLHRFHVDGDRPGTRNGWYVLYADGLPAGAFGSWREGVTIHWCAKPTRRLSAEEHRELRRKQDAAKAARDASEVARQETAARRAQALWAGAAPCALHPYLNRKGVRSHGLRAATWRKWHQDDAGRWRLIIVSGVLLVPLRDFDGVLWNVQAIFPAPHSLFGRDKDFLPGRKRGLCFPIGTIQPTGRILIAEGYATAATLFESTGAPTLAAFDAGNLEPVAVEARRRYPDADIIVCADNDAGTRGNPGLAKGRAAAIAARARLTYPTFPPGVAGSDFNDLSQVGGRQ